MRRFGGDFEKDLPRESLETILQDAVMGVCIVSPRIDGIQLDYTNDAFFKIFGYTREEYEEISDEERMNLFSQADFINIVRKLNTDYDPDDVIEFELRINKKGGEKAWVLVSTRKPRNVSKTDQVFICNITDITYTKKLQMQLREEKERYEIVEEISDDIMFSYDVVEDVFECSAKILRGMGTRTRIENTIETFTYGDVFDHRDVPAFILALSNALSGKKINVFDARVINNRGDGVWHRIKFAAMYGDDGNATRFIGTMTDIDKEKKEKSRLISKAETDQLTGFLNKISTSLKIGETIREYPDEQRALLLLDLDDFKKLNDTYGHQVGDNFLRSFTSKLSLRFGTNDVLGRIGGEEFVVYVSNTGDGEDIAVVAEKTARDILEVCRSVTLEGVNDREFTCSVGIAMYPSDGSSYTELYEKADNAMYSVKRSGKNNFAFYQADTTEM
ncbi:MAG: sensor domain-containing diguanylate cyclase [Clostridia bacterium]|nr:sensor domain-containing diguanylate cyclase [Clostridia bacterium]